jgi:predicted Zn-dependent protease
VTDPEGRVGPPSTAGLLGDFDMMPKTGGAARRSDLGPGPARRGPRLAGTRLALVWLLVFFVLRFADLPALVQGHPAPRTLPVAVVDRILFVAYPDFPVPVADAIRNDIGSRYGIPGSILVSSEPLDPSAWNPARHQFGAERALDAMLGQTFVDPGVRTLVIGLTTADLYIESIDWNWAFALRRHGAALVSMERMHRPLELDGAQALMRKMVVREVGFLAFRLSPTDDPGDLMYRNVLALHDLVAMSDDL